jgi:serine/threonine-protein kinase HipA
MIGHILAATDQPALARETFLRMTLFNLLVGNNDNHAKNNALLHGPGQSTRLAPFYDLVPVQMVGGFREDLAFRLGNAAMPDELTHPDLIQFCTDIGLPERGAAKRLSSAAHDLIESLEQLSVDFPPEMRALDRLFGETAQRMIETVGLDIKLRERDAHVVKGGGWALS